MRAALGPVSPARGRGNGTISHGATRMKSSHLILPAAGLSVLAWALMNGGDGRAQPASGTLPGATPVVEAIHFPTIQAALDALPPTGGVVRLPAGTFEIKEPLRITHEDVLLEGAGTATHIKNVNTDGRAGDRHPARRSYATDPRATLWRVQLANLRVTGNERAATASRPVNINEIFLHGVTVSYHGGDGIRLDQLLRRPADLRLPVHLQQGRRPEPDRLPRHRRRRQPVRGEPGRPALHRQLQPLHDRQQPRRPPAPRRRDREHVRLGRQRQHDRGVQRHGDHPRPRLLRHHALGQRHRPRSGRRHRPARRPRLRGQRQHVHDRQEERPADRPGQRSRITVTGNNFSNSYIGDGKVKRGTDDLGAGGIVLDGTSDIAISGNLFSGVTTKALAVEGDPSRRVLFSNNVLTDTAGDQAKLRDSRTGENLEDGTAGGR